MGWRPVVRSLVAIVLVVCGGCGAAAPAATPGPPSPPAACDGSLADLQPRTTPGWAEPPEGPVAEVRVRGARSVPAELVRDAIELPAGEPMDPSTVRDDIRRILELRVFEDVRVHADRSPAGPVITYEVVERPLVRRVHVSGLGEGVQEPRLKRVAGEVFVPARLHRLAAKVASEHEREGYAEAVARVRGRRADSGHVDVCFVVEPGRRWVVERLDFVGNERIDDATLGELVSTFEDRVNAPGGVYREDLLRVDRRRIAAAYYDRGMIDARISEPRTTWEDGGLHVQIPIEEGPVYALGEVTVTGSLDGSEREYLELAGLRSGETFSRERVGAAFERIRERDAHRGVEVWPATTFHRDVHTVDLEIQIRREDEPQDEPQDQEGEP